MRQLRLVAARNFRYDRRLGNFNTPSPSPAEVKNLVEKEQAEIHVLESYLPPEADSAAVERAIAEAIADTGAASPKDMGKVMKAAMAKLAGQTVDGKVVNDLVRQKLAQH